MNKQTLVIPPAGQDRAVSKNAPIGAISNEHFPPSEAGPQPGEENFFVWFAVGPADRFDDPDSEAPLQTRVLVVRGRWEEDALETARATLGSGYPFEWVVVRAASEREVRFELALLNAVQRGELAPAAPGDDLESLERFMG